ncbi:hypothetical protein H4217_005913 [Coemansia sp. RSA 1939]|nr:hypothetical protein H4217_005913 [Coemansia sp. RSA 1939]KAJ2683933.1 hypothetical protein GGH99_004203 [Coemansia sp. RSA 1285]
MRLISTASALILAASVTMAADEAVWKITDLDSGERENLCDRQIQTCQNNCGGPDEAPMAFCNPDTMGWGCGCKSNTPSFKSWNWPVPARDCAGSLAICKENCGSQSGDRNKCYEDCSTSHQCNTEDAPISYTNTTDFDVSPAYVGPAVSYKGDDLGDLNDGNDRTNLGSSSSENSETNDAKNDNSDAVDSSSDHSSATDPLLKSAGMALLTFTIATAASMF